MPTQLVEHAIDRAHSDELMTRLGATRTRPAVLGTRAQNRAHRIKAERTHNEAYLIPPPI
jgi:hypothetical protein